MMSSTTVGTTRTVVGWPHSKHPHDWQWLSLPVHRPHGRHSLIADVRLIEPCQSKYRTLQLMKHQYRRGRYWPTFEVALQSVLDAMDQGNRLADVAEVSTLTLLHLLGWQGQVQRSSELTSSNDRSKRLADLTETVGAEAYLCGTGGRRYLDTAPFKARGLDVTWFESPIADDERPSIWSGARQFSALWALMRFGIETVSKEFDALVGKL